MEVVGLAAADWRAGWLSHGIALGRTADVSCPQLDHLVAHFQERDRTAIVVADKLYDLYLDAINYFVELDGDPNAVLRDLGSPFAQSDQATA